MSVKLQKIDIGSWTCNATCLELAMNRTPAVAALAANPGSQAFVIRFKSLFKEGRALTFPCDAQGRVDLDTLPERARGNYLFARALVGRDYSTPLVCLSLVD